MDLRHKIALEMNRHLAEEHDWVTSDAQMAYHFLFSLFSIGTVYSKAQGNKDRYFGMSIRPVTSENHVAL